MQQKGPTFNSSSNTITESPQQHQMTSTVASNIPMINTNNYATYGIAFPDTVHNIVSERDETEHVDKRSAHNALERQRREGLNNKLQELALALPALQEIRRPSKSMIVGKSLEFVTDAEKRELRFKSQINQLRREHQQLIRQANLSRKRMKKRAEQQQDDKLATTSNGKQQSLTTSPSNQTVVKVSSKLKKRQKKQSSASPPSCSTKREPSPGGSDFSKTATRKRPRDSTPQVLNSSSAKLFEDLTLSHKQDIAIGSSITTAGASKRRKRHSPIMASSPSSSVGGDNIAPVRNGCLILDNSNCYNSVTARIAADSTHSGTSGDQPYSSSVQKQNPRQNQQQSLRRQSVGIIISPSTSTTTIDTTSAAIPTTTPVSTSLHIMSPSTSTFDSFTEGFIIPTQTNTIIPSSFGHQEHIFYNSSFDIISSVPALGIPTTGNLQQQQYHQQQSASAGVAIDPMHHSPHSQHHYSHPQDIDNLFNSLIQQPQRTTTSTISTASSPLSNESLYRFAF
ncbi:hypothetical protein BDF20DRAFT_851301 [Mycotypha africana]|uniref:uncharacterized protein n=1 Tax=Mycotypha africana TaxID=64632 RepID=UPI002300AC12|nr:uncharacterized protein BDF20DRAFT_851301 [Mycotypha africana]KAI8987629.1 hypothetical protein BDF20DRAFT_851301 [Mycotypha africana]